MLGLSSEEEEESAMAPAPTSAANRSYPLPAYAISQRSKSIKLVLPDSIVTSVQVLMGYYSPFIEQNPSDSSVLGNAAISPHPMQLSSLDPINVTTSSNVDITAAFLLDKTSSDNRGAAIPPAVRAFAFITMGKFCIRSKLLAQNHVNVFLRELDETDTVARDMPEEEGNSSSSKSASKTPGRDERSLSVIAALESNNLTLLNSTALSATPSASAGGGSTPTSLDRDARLKIGSRHGSNVAVRSNALLVLGDLCVRYTHLVDRHVGMMAKCLQDGSVVIRKNAIILLTQVRII